MGQGEQDDLRQVVFLEAGHAHEVSLEPFLQGPVAVDGHGEPDSAAFLTVDVAATVDAEGTASRVARGCARTPSQKRLSYGDLDHAGVAR